MANTLRTDKEFKARVEGLVAQIPPGRVMTYGQIAALCGNPRASRIVGGIAHFGAAYLHTTPDCPLAQPAAPQEFLAQSGVGASGTHSPYHLYGSLHSSASPSSASKCEGCGGVEIPWWRVVMKDGGLARGFPGGLAGHRAVLEQEGITASEDYKIDVGKLLWQPPR